MYGLEDADDKTFQTKVDPIVKEIGGQGQVKHSSGADLFEGAHPYVAPTPTRLRQGTVFGPAPEPRPQLQPRSHAGDVETHATEPAHDLPSPSVVASASSAFLFSPPLPPLTPTVGEGVPPSGRLQLASSSLKNSLCAQGGNPDSIDGLVMTDQEPITMPQLTELHARIEALQLAEFLSEDEAFDLLDCVSDAIELRQTWLIQGRRRVHDTELELMITISKMVGLAQIIKANKALARQFRRKFVNM